jgi:hypothetical protein
MLEVMVVTGGCYWCRGIAAVLFDRRSRSALKTVLVLLWRLCAGRRRLCESSGQGRTLPRLVGDSAGGVASMIAGVVVLMPGVTAVALFYGGGLYVMPAFSSSSPQSNRARRSAASSGWAERVLSVGGRGFASIGRRNGGAVGVRLRLFWRRSHHPELPRGLHKGTARTKGGPPSGVPFAWFASTPRACAASAGARAGERGNVSPTAPVSCVDAGSVATYPGA